MAVGVAGGTISASGLYTASRQGGSDVVIATSAADATKRARATVTVTPDTTVVAPAIAYSPTSLTCTRGVACSLAAPRNSGGPIASLAIAPALPRAALPPAERAARAVTRLPAATQTSPQ